MVLQSRDTRLIIMVCKICIICEGTAPTALSGGAKHVCENCVNKPVSDALCVAAKQGIAVKGIRVVEKNFIAAYAQMAGETDPTPVIISRKPQVLKAEAATALVPKLKHGTDDIWYIKYFYSIVESENRVKWYQTDAYANEDAKTLTTVMVRSQKALP
jgi:hypothetical protein